MIKHALALVVISALFVASAQVLSSSLFIGQGQAVIIDNNVIAAKKIAHNAARTQALTQAMEAYISAGQVDRHKYKLIKGKLLSSNPDFILAEKVIVENRQGILLKLSLQITIDMETLAKALGKEGLATHRQVTEKKHNKPTVVVIVAEELNGSMNSFSYSIGVIQNRLLARDYPLVDQAAASRSAKHEQAVQAMLNHNLASARALALQFDAGLMITGRAVVQKSGIQGGGMNAYGANIALNAIAADSGRVLATSSAAGTYPHINAMLGSRIALEEAAAKAIDQLLGKLSEQEYNISTPLGLTVSGVNYQQMSILKKILLKEFPLIDKINTRGFTGNFARLDLTLTGSVAAFTEALAMKNFGGFRLKVLSQSNEKVDTVLVKK